MTRVATRYDAETRLQMRELLDRYVLAVNLHDWDQLEDTFAEDAVWEILAPYHMRAEGPAGITDAIRNAHEGFEFCVMMTSGAQVGEISDDRATVQSTLFEMVRAVDHTSGITLFGIYHDEVVRTHDGWRFASRRFQIVYMDTAPPPGQFIPTAPSP